ncbi:MAG: hypothetical protein ACAH95_00345 [Fimbriimonas sp.]
MNPLQLLRRTDKWFLGGGHGAIYAPPFPRFLTTPGFAEECYLADIRIPGLFSVIVLDAQYRPVKFDSKLVDWCPHRLVLSHSAPGVEIRETRCVTESNAWVSCFEVLAAPTQLHFFQWSLMDVRPPGYAAPWSSLTSADVLEQSLAVRFETAWPEELAPDRTAVEEEQVVSGASKMLAPLPVYLELGGSLPRRSWTVNLAQRHDESPLYELSVLPEKFVGGTLPCDYKLFVGTDPVEGMAHLVQHFVVEEGQELVLACGSGMSAAAASSSLQDAVLPGVVERSERDWRR